MSAKKAEQTKKKKKNTELALWFWVDEEVLFYCSNRVKESGLWLISEAERSPSKKKKRKKRRRRKYG